MLLVIHLRFHGGRVCCQPKAPPKPVHGGNLHMEALVAPPQPVHGGNLHMEAPVAVVRLLSHIYAGYSAIINDCNFSYD
jgi:hypothetical protein